MLSPICILSVGTTCVKFSLDKSENRPCISGVNPLFCFCYVQSKELQFPSGETEEDECDLLRM